ncbi:hypothetical protein FNV43_RR13981 [Rhamnella rubrinervis]|uniref:non-specific serine/threonine protein kinase n=1 Tax=Rhamnella rubrinervis TaxID=2594499 RepID=A0A8K0MFS5_9ROSA|nr:hypothetical protein FNV43_RR13981 [Rhamnella rubrinervis]
MHSIPLSPTITALVLLFSSSFFFFYVDVTTSFPSNETLSECSETFNCGTLRNVSYPFTSDDGPDHCGPPEFRLSCLDDFPEITIASLRYRVRRLDPFRRTLTLARLDLWNVTCPDKLINATLGSTSVFRCGENNSDLTMFYGCSSLFLRNRKPENLFHCNNMGSFSDSYFWLGQVPDDLYLSLANCSDSLTVPILQSMASNLVKGRSLLAEALMGGFNVNYSLPNDGGSSKISLGAGLGIAGACVIGILLGACIFFIIQKKKKRAIESKSKDLPTPPSSKSLPTTSINFSQSIPSYPFSKTDLEKGSTYFGTQVFSYTELEEATNNFDPSRELGEGGFGTVYYGNLHDGRVVAVKRLYENNFKRVEQFMNEVEILTRLQHKNLVKLYGCTSRRSRELLLVYEFIPNGTVADHIHGKRSSSGLLSWPVRLNIAIETADALAYLHRSDIIHRDVKTNNILLDNNFCVKVADFGLSRLFPNDVTHVSTAPQGTPGYVDPEYYQCYQLTDKSDVYSFGVVLIELVSSLQAVDTNRQRLDVNLANMAVNKIQNHSVNELVDPCLGFESDDAIKKMTTAVAELAFRCLQQERDMRPSMDEVVRVLKAIKNEDYDMQKAEVVDIRTDEIRLLKSMPPPLSPDSVVVDKWVSSSTTTSSFST